jgi:4-amino-4-deoxy-L-arabinose transferase-like glycosyltransferase
MQRAAEQLERIGGDRLRRWGPWVLALLALVLYLPGNNVLPLLDRDEPRFAQASREMIERDEWIVPYFNGQYRFDKPILIYWLMRGAYAVFGVNEFAARLPSALCAAALVALLCHIGTRWFSPVVGVVAGFGLLTCVQMLLHARSAVADMPMVLAVLVAHWALWELIAVEQPRLATLRAASPTTDFVGREARWVSRRWFWLFWVSLGVGFLAKGPVAILLPGLTLLFYRFASWRQPVPWRRLRPELGIPVMLVIIAAWGIPALVRTHGEFFQVGIGRHVVKRGVASFEGHGSFAPHYYFVTALFSLFPWIAFAGDGLRATRQNWNAKNAFLVSWVAGAYLLFTVYLTKLPHYVLPAFPALFLLLGQASKPVRWTTVWFWIVASLGLVLAAAALAVTLNVAEHWRGLSLALAGILAALVVLVIYWRAGRVRRTWLPLAVVVMSIVTLGLAWRRLAPAVAIQRLAQFLPAETRCGSWRYGEPSLVFYTARRWENLAGPEAVQTFLRAPGPCLVVCQEQETRLEDHWKRWRGQPVKPRDSTAALAALDTTGLQQLNLAGLNMARVSWVQLRLYYRTH